MAWRSRTQAWFDYNIYDNRQSMSKTIHDFLRTYDLICTPDLDPSFNPYSLYTRSCEKSETYSLLDFIFISSSLRDRVTRCGIDYDGRNPSDHFPVMMQLDIVPLVAHTGDDNRTVTKNDRVAWSQIP